MDLNKIFCEENIGLPVKIRMGRDENDNIVYHYGRYYGRGLDGEKDLHDEEATIVCAVDPHGARITAGCFLVEFELTHEDLEKLHYFEELEKEPYGLYFDIEDGKYTKNYKYKEKLPLSLHEHPREWFDENGLFTVSTDVLGNAFAKLFSKVYGEEYYYQKLSAHCEDTDPYEWKRKRDNRCMRIISPIKYNSDVYSSTQYYGLFKLHYYNDHGIYQPDYTQDNLFKHVPVKLKDGEFLMYFSMHWNPEAICIGYMYDEKGNEWRCRHYDDSYQFVPRNLAARSGEGSEVQYDNTKFDVVPDFLRSVFDYKIEHRKLDLDNKDMNVIINKFVKGLKKSKNMTLVNPDVKK